jgi:hypothetical protein
MSSLQMPIHRPSALPQSRTNLAAEKRPPALQGLKIPGIRLTIKSYADIHNRNPNWTDTGRPPTRFGDAWLDPRRNSKTRPIPHRVDRICDSLRLQSRNKDLPSPETLTEVTSTPLNHRGQPGWRITHEGKTKFVPDSSWTSCTRNGKRGTRRRGERSTCSDRELDVADRGTQNSTRNNVKREQLLQARTVQSNVTVFYQRQVCTAPTGIRVHRSRRRWSQSGRSASTKVSAIQSKSSPPGSTGMNPPIAPARRRAIVVQCTEACTKRSV